MDGPGRHLVYSVTKTFLGVLCLRLDLDLEARVATWIDDGRLPRTSLLQLVNHTSGIPDYGRLAAYGEAVRVSPGEPWSDEEVLGRARSLAVSNSSRAPAGPTRTPATCSSGGSSTPRRRTASQRHSSASCSRPSA